MWIKKLNENHQNFLLTSRRLKVLGYRNRKETNELHHTKSCMPGSNLKSHNCTPSYLNWKKIIQEDKEELYTKVGNLIAVTTEQKII